MFYEDGSAIFRIIGYHVISTLNYSLKWVLFEKKDFQTSKDIERRGYWINLSATIKQLWPHKVKTFVF